MKAQNSAIGLGLLTAIASSLCCIIPFIAIVAGTSSLAANFSWIEPLRPWLYGLSILALAFAWYAQLRPKPVDDCGCETGPKSFFQTKTFLGFITVFALLMMAFPYYSGSLLGNSNHAASPHAVFIAEVPAENIVTVEFEVEGMTCGGCEKHVSGAVYDVAGVIEVKASYKDGNTIVLFDRTKTNVEEIQKAIASTGYKVSGYKILKSEGAPFSDLATFEYHVTGMTCGGCEVNVKSAIGKLDGVQSVSASYKEEKVVVSFDPTKTSKEEIEKSIALTGYKVEKINEK